MNDPVERQDILISLAQTGKVIGRLAADEKAFKATVEAFRAGDGASYQRHLLNLKILPECELICFWLRSKQCVIECREFCGIPDGPLRVEDIPEAARAIARITENHALTERLVAAVQKRDANAFRNLLKELKAERYCHLICHWVCIVYWRLICEIVCVSRRIVLKELVTEFMRAGQAIRQLTENRKVLDEVIKAAIAVDCEVLSGLLDGQVNCFVICEWICSWHCLLVCLPFCRPFPVSKDISIDEMRAFAQTSARLAERKDVLGRLVDYILAGNVEAFGALIKEFKIEPYCIQLCHWICFTICRRFCICVCPPAPTMPLFTHVGQYKITTDFAADGTTNAGSFAFTQTIPLIGILPDGTAPDALEYHFRVEQYPLGGGAQDVVAAMIPATRIGELEFWEWNGAAWVINSADYWVNNPGATVNIAQQIGPNLVVPVNKDVKPGGWIEVPRENSLFIGGVGRFIPNTGILANLDTTTLTNEQFDLSVNAPPLPLKAGDSVPAAQKSQKPLFKIYFEAREVVGGAPVGANNLDVIALSNTQYKYIRHTDWAGGPVTTPLVLSVDVVELLMNGCSPLQADVHALYSAYHPYLGTCDVRIEGPGVPPPNQVNPAITALGEAVSPAGGQDFDISQLQPCAYILWLEATLRLTSGYGGLYGTFQDHLAFCKH